MLCDGSARLVALAGPPGFGKSVLARLIAAAIDTKEGSKAPGCCPGGVVWLDVGQDPDLSGLLAQGLTDLTGQPGGGRSVEQLASELSAELATRRCLLVLDDVWPSRTGKDDVVGLVLSRIEHVPGLVTTRSVALLDAEPDARCIDVAEMGLGEATDLLATALPGAVTANDEAQLGGIARQLGRWPLLLRLAAAHLRRLVPAGYLWTKLCGSFPAVTPPRESLPSTPDTPTSSMSATLLSGNAPSRRPSRPALRCSHPMTRRALANSRCFPPGSPHRSASSPTCGHPPWTSTTPTTCSASWATCRCSPSSGEPARFGFMTCSATTSSLRTRSGPLLAVLARLGQADRAVGYAALLAPGERIAAPTDIASALAGADPGRGRDLADQAIAAADHIDDHAAQAEALAGMPGSAAPGRSASAGTEGPAAG